MYNGDSATIPRRPLGETASRMAVLVLLFTFGAILESVKLSSLANPEIWGHLRVGGWILEHRTWPHTGIFSQVANLRWRDFTWGYDVVAAAANRVLGLRAVPALLIIFRLLVAAVVFLLAGTNRENFWFAAALSALAQVPLLAMGPVAGGASVILFALELFLLLESRRSGDFRVLLPLPVLFFVWANLDIGFIYGVGVLALFLATLIVEGIVRAASWSWFAEITAPVAWNKVALVGGGCLVATLLNPYAHDAYSAFWAIQTSVANRELPEHAAMKFHQPQDYLVLLLAMVAFLMLGLRRSRDLFLFGLLMSCTILSFHAQSENWLITLSAIAAIGAATVPRRAGTIEVRTRRWGWQGLGIAGATLSIVLAAFVMGVPRDKNVLMQKVAESFPVRACDAIRTQQLPQPFFNTYAWGAFLTWYLPEYPVAIDARRGLYPEAEEADYFKVMNAEIPYRDFAPMKQARTLLLEKGGTMGEALRGVAGFHVVYEDKLAIVLSHEQGEK